jgi:1,4-alpha-glucan branching enzyme
MRICFLCQEDIVIPQGGTGTYVRNISIALAARGHDVHVISRQRGDAPGEERVAGVVVHRVPAPGPTVLYSPLYFARARRLFTALHRRQPFDLIHGNLPLMSSWAVRGASLPPVVETVHCTVREELRALTHTPVRRLNLSEMLTRLLAPIIRSRERWLLRRAGQVIAVSRALRAEVLDQYDYPVDRITVIPNGVDQAHFAGNSAAGAALRQRLGIPSDARVILYLGRLVERKRAIDLVQALPQVLKTVPQARLVIVGRRTANAVRLEEAVTALGLTAHVTFVAHVPYAEVPAYYAMADVYALPSAYEGFPFTVLEAMASGTPVVASAIPGVDEQILDGLTGLLHPVGDVAALARCLEQVLRDSWLAGDLAAAARRVVADYYDWDTIGTQTEQLLLRVAGAQAAAPNRLPALASLPGVR